MTMAVVCWITSPAAGHPPVPSLSPAAWGFGPSSREILRLWMRGESQRGVERLAGVDRKTVRRYVEAATGLGLVRDGGESQLDESLIGSVVEAVRPHRSDGHGDAWRVLVANHDQIKAWLDADLTVVKVHDLLTRKGVVVPERTLHRYALEVLDHRRGPGPTVRVADGRPGDECQVDFGRMGSLFDPVAERNRAAHALIFTACFSRHSFVWVSFTQTTQAVIEGCEAAWAFFGGVFPTVIPDNMSAIVDKANRIEPRFNQAFVEYAQARGFPIDPARVRRPKDKPRVERTVPYVRASFFAGEHFVDRDRRPAPGRGVVSGQGRHAHPRHDPVPAGRAVRPRGGAPPAAGADHRLRRADLCQAQGPPRPPHRGRQGAVFGARQPDRPPRRGPGRPGPGQGLLPGPADQGPSPPTPGGRITDPADLPVGKDRVRHA